MARWLFPIVVVMHLTSAANAQTHWDHNGSVMSLYANGANRQFVYYSPRAGLPVSSGSTVFKGVKSGDTYSGTAYAFSSRCGAIGYSVSGTVSPDQRSVTVYGQKPSRLDRNCRATEYSPDELVFTFIDPNQSVATNDQSAESPSETEICLRPVFIEEMRLREMIDGKRSTTQWVAQALNHLKSKYCAIVTAEIEPDDSVSAGDTGGACQQYTGLYRGERVFWGACHE